MQSNEFKEWWQSLHAKACVELASVNYDLKQWRILLGQEPAES